MNNQRTWREEGGVHNEEILGSSVFVIHGFISHEECVRFIADSEQQGYEGAPITTSFGPLLRQDVRNNDRIMIDDSALAANWFQRAEPFLPSRLGEWKLLGLNERFRFYRYDPGQTFKRHYDGSYYRSHIEQSFLTFMVYLNEGYTGGTTEFYDVRDQPKATVRPKEGMALVFDHQQVHEGAVVESGRKYVLRTDVMYSRRR